MRYWRWVWVGLAVCALLTFMFYPRKVVHRAPDKTIAKPQDATHIDVKDASLSLLDEKSNIRWELKIINVQEDSSGMKLTTVSGLYFPEKGKPFKLRAKLGRISKDMNHMTLDGGVQLTQPGYLLQGSKLIWASNVKGFQMLGGIRLESQKMRGEGENMMADSSLQHVRFVGESRWQALSTLSGEGKNK